MTTRRLIGWATLATAAFALSGCYTVLQGPRLLSANDDGAPDPVWDVDEQRYAADSDDPRESVYDDYPYQNTYEEYGHGYPVMRAASGFGLYGFGSPFAYGPGLGSAYSYGYGGYGGYSPAYGPYGYGYDPYYSDPYYRGGGSSYVPPGYELVTARELANLRTENAALRSGSTVNNTGPSISQQEALRRQQLNAERAWTQREVPALRKSTTEYRTAKPQPEAPKATTSVASSGSSSGTSSKPASSSTKSSGSSAAKRSKTNR
ncbi:MAG: hypothetical protein O2782_06475 [bacterium]|nr:hypothetical protein [bacterium]